MLFTSVKIGTVYVNNEFLFIYKHWAMISGPALVDQSARRVSGHVTNAKLGNIWVSPFSITSTWIGAIFLM